MRMTPLLYVAALVLISGCGRPAKRAPIEGSRDVARTSVEGLAVRSLGATAASTPRPALVLPPRAVAEPPPPPSVRSAPAPADVVVSTPFPARLWVPVGASVRRPDLSSKDPSVGSPDAPVTAVVFGDHQCPYTGRALETLFDLQRDYGATQLRVVWKSLPLSFHKRARAAALAGQAVHVAGGGVAFFSFTQALLADRTTLDDAKLEETAAAVGVARSTYRSILAEAGIDLGSKIDGDADMAASLGIRGVPYVFINEREVSGAQPKAVFAAAIDEAIASPACAGPT